MRGERTVENFLDDLGNLLVVEFTFAAESAPFVATILADSILVYGLDQVFQEPFSLGLTRC